ncbi:MGH1-like glycoside hydrolase domain-containing protein [Maribellus luteus]|nr:trehalase family glycosidase [Maribellus luteus]
MGRGFKYTLLALCLFFSIGSAIARKFKDKVSRSVSSELINKNNGPTNDRTNTKFVNNRTDNDLVAAYGTCYLNDFRFFTMLHQDAWNFLRWETMGNAVLAHRTWRNWPYEQHLNVKVDGQSVSPESIKVDEVEQQFDFRQVAVSSPAVKIKRLDLMASARHWITALQVTNPKEIPSKITIEFDWTEINNAHLDIRPWSDNESKGFAYSFVDGPPVIVSVGANGSWEKRGDNVASNRWELNLEAGETRTLDLDVYIGWATIPEYMDKGPGIIASDQQATIDRRSDKEGFRQLALQSVSSFSYEWDDLQQICESRRHYLYDRMPRLSGVEPEWEGMWSYTFDLIRSGIYPAQGNFKDVWKVESLDVYREPFYWDGPASIHTFCNWDADLGARTLRTFLSATKENGELTVSANPYRAYANPTPQLANITMALWDCYQVTQDKEMLASCYPLMVKHVRWLETERNRSPKGPLMDIGYNIDYGPKEFYDTPTIWPDVQFFLVDRYQKLAKIADVIDRPKNEVAEWSNRANRLTEAIRKYMWDDENGTFWCLTDKLKYKPIPSPIEFHGMIAGVATNEQAHRLLTRLQDTAKYAPSAKYPYGLPSAPFDSPYFVVADSWSGTIWPVQTYYTVRGLVNYGFQNEAAALSRNLYGMMARDYAKSGSIWEQYDPRTGNNLSNGFEGNGTPEVGRGYFTSGITTSVVDALLRGCWGFERTDNPNTFFLTPAELTNDWQGIENLPLSGDVRMRIQMKEEGEKYAFKIKFNGLSSKKKVIKVQKVNVQNGSFQLLKQVKLNFENELDFKLKKEEEIRYLWTIEE